MDIHTSPLAWTVIGCAIEVHRVLGPGLLESAYDKALCGEFTLRGVGFRRQVGLPGSYKGQDLGRVYRVDFVAQQSAPRALKAHFCGSQHSLSQPQEQGDASQHGANGEHAPGSAR